VDGSGWDGQLHSMGVLLSEKDAAGTHVNGGMDRLQSRLFFLCI
jgi:hypothetical protein